MICIDRNLKKIFTTRFARGSSEGVRGEVQKSDGIINGAPQFRGSPVGTGLDSK
jgi:hypothetical protein